MIQLTFDGCRITYLTRLDWSAGPLRAGRAVPLRNFIGWYLHHTVFLMADYDRDGMMHGDLDDIRRYMQILQGARPDLGGEVPYSSLPFRGEDSRSCVVVDGRGPGWSGAHTAGENDDHYAWALPTNSAVEPPTEGQIAGMRWIASEWTPWATDPAKGHQQAAPYWQNGVNLNATACPGVPGMAALPLLQPPYTADTKEWDEMATKDEIKDAVREVLQAEGLIGENGTKDRVERIERDTRIHLRSIGEKDARRSDDPRPRLPDKLNGLAALLKASPTSVETAASRIADPED